MPRSRKERGRFTANETDFSGGSAAERAFVGYGAGRAHIEIEYKLTNPANPVVWTEKIKTKGEFWGWSGGQNQGEAVDGQAQKLTDALSKYFGVAPAKK